MIHAPMLRNFYLSGGHTRSQCTHSLAKPCLSCELVRCCCKASSVPAQCARGSRCTNARRRPQFCAGAAADIFSLKDSCAEQLAAA